MRLALPILPDKGALMLAYSTSSAYRFASAFFATICAANDFASASDLSRSCLETAFFVIRILFPFQVRLRGDFLGLKGRGLGLGLVSLRHKRGRIKVEQILSLLDQIAVLEMHLVMWPRTRARTSTVLKASSQPL